jgi:hypothetical protein
LDLTNTPCNAYWNLPTNSLYKVGL